MFFPLILLFLFWDVYATYPNSQCYKYRDMEVTFKVLTEGKEGDHLETGPQRRTSMCMAINILYSGTRRTE